MWAVAVADPASRLELSGEGPRRVRLAAGYRLEDVAGGTRVSIESSMDGVPRALRGVAGRQGEQMADDSVRRLRSMLAGEELATADEPSLTADVWSLLRWPLEQPGRVVKALVPR